MTKAAELMISSDSHVIEPNDLWEKNLPATYRSRAPHWPKGSITHAHPGGTDPTVRVKEMSIDGVSGEVLYPSLPLRQFGMTDPAFQEACFRVYNDWLIDYCAHAPDRLFGVALISTYNIDNAVKELHRCKKAGMRGAMIWQIPPEEIPFTSDHYERFWAACQDLQMPVSLHILTGMPYPPVEEVNDSRDASWNLNRSVNMKLLYVTTALTRIIASGVLERYPKLKLVLVENEVSWLPFVISQWDKYCARGTFVSQMTMLPGEYIKRQVYATFFNDPPSRWMLGEWGADNCMWSNDYPHPNSTWPKSRKVIARDLGHLSAAKQAKLLHKNVAKLYDLPKIKPLAA